MATIYRTAGAWGSGKGSKLTWAEVDNNFYGHETRIAALELGLPSAARGIDSITQSVDLTQISFVMTDLSTEGPFALPQFEPNPTGAWQPLHAYKKKDWFNENGNLYQVQLDHVSATIFDPDANDGMGHDYYFLLLSNPGATLPTGGDEDWVMYKETNADFDVGWRPSGIPRAGTANQILAKLSGTDFDTAWVNASALLGSTLDALNDVTITSPVKNQLLMYNGSAWVNSGVRGPITTSHGGTSLNLVADDAWKFFLLSNVAGCTVIIPEEADVNFPVDTEISFRQEVSGGGLVQVTAAGSVTLDVPESFTASLLGQYAVCTIKKIAADQWTLFGLLEPV